MCLGVPGEVTSLFERDGLPFAKVRFGAVTRDVCLAYQEDARPGEFVLVHVGFAIARLDAAEAARTFELLTALGQVDEELGPGASAAAGDGEGREP